MAATCPVGLPRTACVPATGTTHPLQQPLTRSSASASLLVQVASCVVLAEALRRSSFSSAFKPVFSLFSCKQMWVSKVGQHEVFQHSNSTAAPAAPP